MNQKIDDAIQGIVEFQRRFIKTNVKDLTGKVSNTVADAKDSKICFTFICYCFDNFVIGDTDPITSYYKFEYDYDTLDINQVTDDIINEIKQLAKDKRDYTPVLDAISVAIEEDRTTTHDYSIVEYINQSIYDDLKDLVNGVSPKELHDAPIMMRL